MLRFSRRTLSVAIATLLAVAAEPLISLVYGAAWGPASAVLPWLALLGALRIVFELIYDYFVVLASTRVVFTVQVVWLLVLVPAVLLGARSGGSAWLPSGPLGPSSRRLIRCHPICASYVRLSAAFSGAKAIRNIHIMSNLKKVN
mgnify:CR=1 FL=1